MTESLATSAETEFATSGWLMFGTKLSVRRMPPLGACTALFLATVLVVGVTPSVQSAGAATSANVFRPPLPAGYGGHGVGHHDGHAGWDLTYGTGPDSTANVVAVADGRVVDTIDKCDRQSGNDAPDKGFGTTWGYHCGSNSPAYGGFGNSVVLQHVLSDGTTIHSSSSHLDEVDVAVGECVRAGEPVGELGHTGYSTGEHLHFEMHIGPSRHGHVSPLPSDSLDPGDYIGVESFRSICNPIKNYSFEDDPNNNGWPDGWEGAGTSGNTAYRHGRSPGNVPPHGDFYFYLGDGEIFQRVGDGVASRSSVAVTLKGRSASTEVNAWLRIAFKSRSGTRCDGLTSGYVSLQRAWESNSLKIYLPDGCPDLDLVLTQIGSVGLDVDEVVVTTDRAIPSGGRIDVAWNGVGSNGNYKGRYIRRGESLTPGDYIASDNLRAVLMLQRDGNLVLAVEGRVIWESGTNGWDVDRAVLQASDGNFVLYAGDDPVWDPRDLRANQYPVIGSPYENSTSTGYLVVQNDGNVVAYNSNSPSNSTYWWHTHTQGTTEAVRNIGDANLTAGQSIRRGEYIHNLDTTTPHALILQGDGNLVLYGPGADVEWDANTDRRGAVRATMQHDGNFVLYRSDDSPVAATGTGGRKDRGVFIRLGNDGNLVVHEPVGDGTDVLWRLSDGLRRYY